MIGQRPERAAQRPPQRLVLPRRHQPGHLRLIQPQPHERIRRGRDRLQRPGPLADHRDQLLARVGIPLGGAEQLRRAHPGRHPERHQRPVPVRAQRREQLAELLIRDLPRPAPDQLRPVQPAALRAERLHRVPVRARAPATAPRQRERVHHRPGPCLQVVLVEPARHRLAMGHRGRRVTRPGRRLAGHRIRHRPRTRAGQCRAARMTPVRPGRLARHLQPPDEITGLGPGRLVPRHADRPDEPEPPQQVHPIRPQRRRRAAARLKIRQERRGRAGHLAGRVNQLVRLERTIRRPQRSRLRDHQRRQVPLLA